MNTHIYIYIYIYIYDYTHTLRQFSAVPGRDVPCRDVLCCAMSGYPMLCHAMPCHAMPSKHAIAVSIHTHARALLCHSLKATHTSCGSSVLRCIHKSIRYTIYIYIYIQHIYIYIERER